MMSEKAKVDGKPKPKPKKAPYVVDDETREALKWLMGMKL